MADRQRKNKKKFDTQKKLSPTKKAPIEKRVKSRYNVDYRRLAQNMGVNFGLKIGSFEEYEAAYLEYLKYTYIKTDKRFLKESWKYYKRNVRAPATERPSRAAFTDNVEVKGETTFGRRTVDKLGRVRYRDAYGRLTSNPRKV